MDKSSSVVSFDEQEKTIHITKVEVEEAGGEGEGGAVSGWSGTDRFGQRGFGANEKNLCFVTGWEPIHLEINPTDSLKH